MCSQVVSGEIPAVQTAIPALDVLPLVIAPVASLPADAVVIAANLSVVPDSVPPPPTLISLSCCLNV